MAVSVFDLFKIGIGPSSSHTVGPMRAARTFALRLQEEGKLARLERLKVELFGSLGATGKGHGSDKAVVLGLMGETPEHVDVESLPARIARWRTEGRVAVLGQREVAFREGEQLVLHRRRSLPFHPNGMRFCAADAAGTELAVRTYYSVGGGFVVNEEAAQGQSPVREDETPQRFSFHSAAELLKHCERERLPISAVMFENEKAWRPEADIRAGLLRIWEVMQSCVKRGCETPGILPGGLKVERRASKLYQRLLSRPEAGLTNPLTVLDWVNLYALAVNEENAAGGRVVTAPTNGAAGIIPALLHYYWRFVPGADEAGVVRFLLTAGAIGVLYKENASISGAEVGCQGEVGSACSMAAGALTEVLGGSPRQVENAAEIAMEHNLGLTCDPIGGLVQVPCIERNAMASVKAINAARMALSGDGTHFVSLDKVIKTMRDTGRDMKDKYKETARGGLAVNVLEVSNLSVGLPEC
ncbi:L-serine ammonia-lyase [Stigmatella aurantiaca]|uniref:L-serine dehydratase n=1 Tax=Stigmatella aurantiaca (strain DW4/3-1) TaxID=378806 RepID=Q09A49_STIAD|nr:L-serine ammonia-lyase [Stigmatella aurantiaca]ADO68896.1 L-serine ammonia-lyase [Stigmatella aurantiaca DW4/3-1]EAU68569.1 L-serine ammonia-lyase [Stigmatella aurantiaca DW4/3-1]